MKFLGTSITALEWYDNAICMALTDTISSVFFPDYDVSARFMLFFMSIAIGYLGRPLGAFILGHYSDKHSRIKSAYFGFAIMVFASLAISFLPTYYQVGIIAPILFVTLRFLQGMAIGGNYGVAVCAVEAAHKSERYMTSSMISVGITLGFLFGSMAASVLTYFFDAKFLMSFGWRIGLWSSALLSLPVFLEFRKIDMGKTKKPKQPQADTEKLDWLKVAKVFVLFLLDMVPFYLLFVFLPNYKIMFLGCDSSAIWFYNSVAMVVIVLCTPFFGKMADAYGALPILKACALGLVVCSWFGPWQSNVWSIVFGVLMGMCYSCLYGYVALAFPESMRARASGVLFNITGSLSVGITPMVSAYLAGFSFYYVSAFLAVVCAVIFATLLTLHEQA